MGTLVALSAGAEMSGDLMFQTADAGMPIESSESISIWGARMVRALDAMEGRRRASVARAHEDLAKHTFEVLNGATSITSELVGVRLPAREEAAFGDWTIALQRAAEAHRDTEPLMPHAGVLRDEIAQALERVTTPLHRRLLGRRLQQTASSVAATNRLLQLRDWGEKTGYTDRLLRGPSTPVPVSPTGSADGVTDPASALHLLAGHLGVAQPRTVSLLSAEDGALLSSVLARGGNILEARERLASSVRSAFASVQDRMVHRQLTEMALSALRDASKDQVRLGALEAAGFRSVQDVLDRHLDVASVPGMGGQSARTAVATARALHRAAKEDLKLRIDLDETDRLLTTLVNGLRGMLVFEDHMKAHREDLEELVALLGPLEAGLSGSGEIALMHRHSPRRGADVVRHLQERAAWVRESGLVALLSERAFDVSASAGSEAWQDFKRRSPLYYGLLGEVVGFEVDVDAVQGHMPLAIVAAVEQQGLDTSLLRPALQSSLRGYQSFGARYALVQRRVLLGDEMGLGKTIQALATMCHLAANGSKHFVVVCPPAVLVNWIKEVRKHSTLEPYRVHGSHPDRERAMRRWQQQGGVAITSFTMLGKLPFAESAPALLVVDEAHFVKNPDTQRSTAVRELAGVCERALYLTGTPLENKVEDFTNLVAQLQPAILDNLDAASMVVGARRFREAVAPVYLRRNSADVLSELPDLVENEEWIDLSEDEQDAYLDALHEHDFHALRRIAITADPARSQKLDRLEALVDEAFSNSRKVLVFSYYREVLQRVHERLGDRVVGLITGSTSPDDRQRLVDLLSASPGPGVLISQIVAGGTGLNLQAASVVILCEPQVKPSLESQAVKRAHRIGQLRSVQVHRLLTTDSVDERMLEILSGKTQIFAQFAEHSEVADASPEATDITESQVAKQVIAQEQERHAKALRARLGQALPVGQHAEDAIAIMPTVTLPPVSPEADPDVATGKVAGHSGEDSGPVSVAKSRAPDQGPKPKTFRPTQFKRSPRVETPIVPSCGSCDRPIDFNGRCGCS